jgi:hypothetical protein
VDPRIHNNHTYGTFVRLHLGANLTLYGSNNPHNQSGGVSDVNQDFSDFEKIPDLIARDPAYGDAAIKYITDDPIRFIKLAGMKLTRFWRHGRLQWNSENRWIFLAPLLVSRLC